MSDTANVPQANVPRRFRFSIGTLLLWMAVVALTANTVITNRRVAQLKQELESQRPLPPREVARQFEENTTLGPIATSVKDVRYSSASDAYRVKYSWVDSTTGKSWQSDIDLKSDGFGTYYGQIRNDPFLQPLGQKEFFVVAVKTPSPLAD